jgi:hypothetical protein
MMNIGVADRQVFGEFCVFAKMPRCGRTDEGFPRPPAIGIAAVAPDATSCTNYDHQRSN